MVAAALQSCIDEQKPSGATRTQKSRVPWHRHPIEDDLTLTTVLGTGHFAATYAATHNQNGQVFAVKSLDKSHPEYSFEDVCNEVEILAAVCDHPNIASLYEVYEDAEHIFLVQEACLGGELFDLVIERKHFTEGDAARACQTLISIISHCHARGVLHRDIKPENFLIKSILGSEEGRFDGSDVRAVDFGLSLFTKDRLDIPDVVGTSYYIAPEILAGKPYSPAADAWSLGIVVFILLSGYPPFWGSSDNVLYDRIQNQELDIAYEPWTTDDVSLEAADFVKRLLHKDPTKRMTLAEAAQHPWLVNAAKNAAGAGTNGSNKNSNTCLSAPLAPVIIDRLRAFTRENRLTCLLMTLVAHHLSDSAIGQLRKTFFSLDTDDDGLIGVADITKALQTTVQQTSATKNTTAVSNGASFAEKQQQEQSIAELVAQLNEAVNVGKNTGNSTAHPIGQVNVDEFLAAALDRKKVLTNRTVSAVFHRLDEKNEGKLNISVLSTALAECGIPVPEENLRSMLAKEGALDGAGVVSPKSFQNLLLAGAEEHNRPAVAALERILSGDLDDLLGTEAVVPDNYLGSDIDNASGVLQLEKQIQNLKLITQNTTPRSLAMTANKSGSTGERLDEVLKQYGASSGYRTPRRNRKGSSITITTTAT
jgi:calcium-dependent protein kinase